MKPMISKGEIVTYVQEYSDTLMLALLAGRRPEKYAKQRLEHSGRIDGPSPTRA